MQHMNARGRCAFTHNAPTCLRLHLSLVPKFISPATFTHSQKYWFSLPTQHNRSILQIKSRKESEEVVIPSPSKEIESPRVVFYSERKRRRRIETRLQFLFFTPLVEMKFLCFSANTHFNFTQMLKS